MIGGGAKEFEVLLKPFGAAEIERGINIAMEQMGR